MRSTIEAKPADPEERSPKHDIARIVGGLLFPARPKHEREHQGGKAGGFVHYDAACKILDVHGRKPAAAPNPVGHGRIAQEHPEARKEQDEAVADALDISAQDECRGDDGEGHLEGEEEHLRDGARQAIAIDAGEHGFAEPAPVGSVAAEGNGVAGDEPKDAHEGGEGHALHEDR